MKNTAWNRLIEKTAMQIAIDLFNDESTPVHDISDVIDECRKLLELEKKQLIEAYDDANTELTNDDGSFITGKQYYANKFKH